MRCDYCPLADPNDACSECEGKYGLDHKDGVSGCRHPRNWVEKRDKDYADYLGDMGTDMGIEMDFTAEELSQVIEICKHMIGLDRKRPYHRHGKAFYKPYRNYYCDTEKGNRLLDRLPQNVVSVERSENYTWYWLTADGLKWLGRQLNIIIKREER